MITDDDIEKALDFLRDNGRKAAKAAAERIYMIEFRKVVKSQLMREQIGNPLAAQERDAYADERYVEHLKAMRTAIETDEYYGWMKTSAEAKIEAWRTQQANHRAEGKIG